MTKTYRSAIDALFCLAAVGLDQEKQEALMQGLNSATNDLGDAKSGVVLELHHLRDPQICERLLRHRKLAAFDLRSVMERVAGARTGSVNGSPAVIIDDDQSLRPLAIGS